jgi:hypothetical protein
MTRFDNIGVEFSTSSGPAVALHQGVFVAGEQPAWFIAHRGSYRVHMSDTLEQNSNPPVRNGIASMSEWNTANTPTSFVVVSATDSELRFCRMAKNVRPCWPLRLFLQAPLLS